MQPAVAPIRRLDRVGRLLPLPLLAAATLLTWVSSTNGYPSADGLRLALTTTAAAAVWDIAVVLPAAMGTRRAAVGYAGHVALTGVLVGTSAWYGIFAFSGYLLIDLVPRRWTAVGLAANALVVAASQIGGYPHTDAATLLLYFGIAAVNITLVLTFVGVNNRMIEQNLRLNAALTENAGLHAQLVAQAREAGVQDERQRLAGEIHDTLAQGLTGIVTQLEAAEHARQRPEVWQRHLDQARTLARSSLVEARRSVRALRPEQLENADLVHAVTELARAWSHETSVKAVVEVSGPARPLPLDVEAALFRVAQEALTNVAKHARAGRVALTLTFLDDVVLLDVRDDGCGVDLSARRDGFGLEGMRQRLDRIGGRLEIESAPGEGLALSAAVGGAS